MGTKIRMVDFKKPLFAGRKEKVLTLATKASNQCIKNAGIHPNELGAIVFTGIYREEHIVEPAMASLIQKKIGANPLLNKTQGTFSFDLNNN